MGQPLSVEYELNATGNPPKALVLFVFENDSLKPISFLDFLNAPISFQSHPLAMIERFDGPQPNYNEPYIQKQSLSDTVHFINSNFEICPYQFKTYRLWFITSPMISQATRSDLVSISRSYPFDNYYCKTGIDPTSLFYDCENVKSVHLALRSSNNFRYSLPTNSNPITTNLKYRRSYQTTSLKTTFATNSSPLQTEIERKEKENDYDKITDNLYIGNENVANNLKLLKSIEITDIVSLNENEFSSRFDCFTYFRIKLGDFVFEEFNKDFWNGITFIKEAIQRGGKVLVHCRKGRSRSAALCIAYLMREQKMSFESAFKCIKEKRPSISVNQGFIQQLQAKEATLTNNNIQKHLLRPNLKLLISK
ncbi:Dual specificity phosphatase, catalytic domain containing protein [Histomonas meleagridis]|uniref:Dual specificity phosphatase, catalytic domain containing protein n=1 Tax=Histomonas meleagridis TaxID=135588 RepID=UPI0035598C19|nr:Dual specificity phosphatase, catalytic domain containing protein [Histomonas meleagridis]KAH0805659.1 Dual specificity phosphatase, catalytic domain containing protein [Histomonas meleagridis]